MKITLDSRITHQIHHVINSYTGKELENKLQEIVMNWHAIGIRVGIEATIKKTVELENDN